MNAILMLMLAADPVAQGTPDVLLLDFTASYCQPCQQMLPVIQRMEHDGYPIRQIDISEQPELARRFRVERIPTLVLMVNGQEVKRFQGLTSEQDLRDEMKRAARQLQDQAGSAGRRDEAKDKDQQQKRAEDEEAARTDAAARSVAHESGRPRLSEVFTGMFSSKQFVRPTLRGQSPDEESTRDSVLAVPEAATVRVQVQGEKIQDVGTGTIIHSTAGKSIILTCAHLFPQSAGRPIVEVDVFQNGTPARFPATILGGSHDSDLAFLQIQNATPLPCAILCGDPESFRSGQAVYSFGCDNGRPPSLLTSKIVRINRYQGPSNLTCERDPVQGRSGGGLFDEQGQLLAVCSAADRPNNEGLYMSIPAIRDMIRKLSLDYVLKPVGEEITAAALLSDTSPDRMLETVVSSQQLAQAVEQKSPFEEFHEDPAASQTATVTVAAAGTTAGPAAFAGTKVTVLIDSRDPAVGERVIVIPQATPWLLELLTGEAVLPGEPAADQVTAARRPISGVR